jgi:hypothetical protein
LTNTIVYQDNEANVLDGYSLFSLYIERSFESLIVNNTPAHINPILGVSLHISKYKKQLSWVSGVKEFLYFSLEFLSLRDLT